MGDAGGGIDGGGGRLSGGGGAIRGNGAGRGNGATGGGGSGAARRGGATGGKGATGGSATRDGRATRGSGSGAGPGGTDRGRVSAQSLLVSSGGISSVGAVHSESSDAGCGRTNVRVTSSSDKSGVNHATVTGLRGYHARQPARGPLFRVGLPPWYHSAAMRGIALWVIGLAVVGACGGSQRGADSPDNAPLSDGRSGTETAYSPPPIRSVGEAPQATATPAAASSSKDAPEISRSVGTAGGVVVLWPRIVQPSGSPPPDASLEKIAADVQAQLAGIARKSGAQVDVRPEPERVCPRSGCKATRIGALVTRADHGCAVVAYVGKPGVSPAHLVPWAGSITLSATQVPFRSHPEKVVRVTDYVPCAKLDLSQHSADVAAALRSAR